MNLTPHQFRTISRIRREIWGAAERQRIAERGLDRRGEKLLSDVAANICG